MWYFIQRIAISYISSSNYIKNSIPKELQEAAFLDGANAAQYLIRVCLPLSKPVLAVVGLYYFVGHWNNYYTALIYIYNNDLAPLQTVLRKLLLSTKTLASVVSDPELYLEQITKANQMKYGVIIVSTAPLLMIYPFVQKHFVKGVMIGSVKG